MRAFRINEELAPYIERVLDRRKISFFRREGQPGFMKAACTGRQFHLAVTRARCEKRNYEEDLPYDETYYVAEIESPNRVREDNPDYIRLIKM